LSDFILVYVTIDSKLEAERFARILLEERLVACVNVVGPVSSFFHWEGRVDFVEEYLMIMKTSVGLFGVLEERVRSLHSYSVPEVVAVPVVEGSKDYFGWLAGVLTREHVQLCTDKP